MMVDIAMTMMETRDFQVCHATDWHQYYCEGPEYDQFAEKFEAFLANLTHNQHQNGQSVHKSPCWGKRHSPFPANTRLLAVGNSHTRQVFLSIKCQYPTLQVIEPEFNEINSTTKRRATHYIIEFVNHAELHLVTNHALFYHKKWIEYLEAILNTKVEYFDLLIVGKINPFSDVSKRLFMAFVMDMTPELEEPDFTTFAPPTLYDFAQLFTGPIVAHSMMADYGEDVLNREMMGLVKRVNRTNVQFVNGRTYSPWLGECASDHWDQVSDCLPKASGHPCIGSRGGHPDLVAWDIIEAVNNHSNTCSIAEFGHQTSHSYGNGY